jgi:hypothetical protein
MAFKEHPKTLAIIIGLNTNYEIITFVKKMVENIRILI